MKIEGETIQEGIPTPDNPVEIINIYKDLEYAVKIVEQIRNRVTLVNVPENNKEYKIPFLNATESQAVTTVLYRLSEYSEEINKLKDVIDKLVKRIKYDTEWFYSDLDNKSEEEIKEYFMKEDK